MYLPLQPLSQQAEEGDSAHKATSSFGFTFLLSIYGSHFCWIPHTSRYFELLTFLSGYCPHDMTFCNFALKQLFKCQPTINYPMKQDNFHCFCRGYLCNGALPWLTQTYLKFQIMIFQFVVLHFLAFQFLIWWVGTMLS